MNRSVPPSPPKRTRWTAWLFRSLLLLLVLVVVVGGGVIIGLVTLARDLPTLRSLADYQPKQATVVYGKDGQIVARFASERRTVVSYDRIPKIMVEAVLAAEDDRFFEHGGLDYLGIFRCLLLNVVNARVVCGGSTITQQTVKTFLLTSERRLVRKAKEFMLAMRVEEALSKEDILYLYLNQIYFGHGAYGVEEAARTYFGKSIQEVDIEEAALLAGLPQSPARLDPYRHPERAVKRRAYVLKRLHALRKIDDAAHERATKAPIELDFRQAERDLDNDTHYAEQVRRQLVELVGGERAIDGGLRVYTGQDPALQRFAESVVARGVNDLDQRQGYRGPLFHLEADQLRSFRAKLEARLREAAPSIAETHPDGFAPVVWDLSEILPPAAGAPVATDYLAEQAVFRRLELFRRVAGVVVEVDDPGKRALVDLGGTRVELPLATGLSWARSFNLARLTRRPSLPSEVVAPGDVVFIRPTELRSEEKPGETAVRGVLEQEPVVQAALLSIDPATRQVRALVGGHGRGSGFNRATQARRQAGSTFKPFLYAAALETGNFTPISTCLDAPQVYRDPYTGQSWKPQNYDAHFDGEISLRMGLTRSKNLCSVWLIHEIGVEKLIDLSHRLGIRSPLPKSDTLALGAGDVTPLEMVNAYTTIAAGGRHQEPIFIRKVLGPSGDTLFEAREEVRQALAPAVAYQITHLMQSVVEDGTAQRVKVLGRPVAGKTGTTNESRNAWFIGFTPELVTGVWVGFDNNDPLGPGETGGRAAIPIWLDFMTPALEGTPPRDFAPPPEIVFAAVDRETGHLALPDAKNVSYEPFVAGSEPTEFSRPEKAPINFGRDDFEQ